MRIDIRHEIGYISSMETLTINIPDKKSTLVKQILRGLGVTIQEKQNTNSDYKDKLSRVAVWNEDDLKSFNDTNKAFNSLKPEQW